MKKKKIFLNIFRNFKYLIFKLLYGQIDKVITAKKNESITIQKISFKNLISYRLYNIPKCRLYSDTVMDTAFILNKSLIERNGCTNNTILKIDYFDSIALNQVFNLLRKPKKNKTFVLLS